MARPQGSLTRRGYCTILVGAGIGGMSGCVEPNSSDNDDPAANTSGETTDESEPAPPQPDPVLADLPDRITVDVVASQFEWKFEYPSGLSSDVYEVPDAGATDDALVMPKGPTITMTITSEDVPHTFGVPELDVMIEATPGGTTTALFELEDTGSFTARCYEPCGQGHSQMTNDVLVLSVAKFEAWYRSQLEAADIDTADQDESV